MARSSSQPELYRQRADGAVRELGARVGLRAQSLYVYFPSKHAIYDAMFAEANRELLDRGRSVDLDADPVIALRRSARQFVDFCTEDLARYQLLFQRTIPGFEPSEVSYSLAREVLDGGRRVLAGVGVTEPADVDLYTGLISGLVAQQNANEPGGTGGPGNWTGRSTCTSPRWLHAAALLILHTFLESPMTAPAHSPSHRSRPLAHC